MKQKKIQKIVVYIMLIAMIASTLLAGLSVFL